MSDEQFDSGIDMPLLLGILIGGTICLAVFALVGFGFYNNMKNQVLDKNYFSQPNPFNVKINNEQRGILEQSDPKIGKLHIDVAMRALLARPTAQQAAPVTQADLDRIATMEAAAPETEVAPAQATSPAPTTAPAEGASN